MGGARSCVKKFNYKNIFTFTSCRIKFTLCIKYDYMNII